MNWESETAPLCLDLGSFCWLLGSSEGEEGRAKRKEKKRIRVVTSNGGGRGGGDGGGH